MAAPNSFKRKNLDTELENEVSDFDYVKNFECDFDTFINLEDSDNHIILFNQINEQNFDQWNDDYVKLPFSCFNLDEEKKVLWPQIIINLKKLSQNIQQHPDSILIELTIKKYYKPSRNFNALHQLFSKDLDFGGLKAEQILKELIPKIVDLCIDLPNKIKQPIPILKSGKSKSISLTQEQCACLLANMFFCTFPCRGYQSDLKNLPIINFDGLFYLSKREVSFYKIEKLKCLLHYFFRITNNSPNGVLTFSRIFLNNENIPNFRKSVKKVKKPYITTKGKIEDLKGSLQLDFANKYIGGGTLSHGCVQEEIRFVICPELIVSMLFTERLGDSESVLIRGSERFSDYKGYASNFEWLSNYIDETPKDKYNRRFTDLLAIDALKYENYKDQFDDSKIYRELIKCYSGFKYDSNDYKPLPTISTGNWGCGVFGGDKQLKFLIQLIASSECDRDMVYFTFNDNETSNCLNEILNLIQEKNLNVGQLYNLITDYTIEIRNLKLKEIKEFELIEFFKAKFNS